MAMTGAIYTTKQAAELLGVSDARIRQLCIEYEDIGVKHGHAWMLMEADILRIKALPEFGKKTRKYD